MKTFCGVEAARNDFSVRSLTQETRDKRRDSKRLRRELETAQEKPLAPSIYEAAHLKTFMDIFFFGSSETSKDSLRGHLTPVIR